MTVLPVRPPARPENSTTVRVSNSPESPPRLRMAGEAVNLIGTASVEIAAKVAVRMFGTPTARPRPAHEHEILERAIRRTTIDVDGRAVAVWEWGEAGPLVVLVHGWEGRAAQLGAVIEPLTDLGFRVVGFDAPAHGDSEGATTHFVDFSRALEAVVDHVQPAGPVHAVIGHSMGGAVTAWTSRRRALAKRYVAIAPPRAVLDFARSFEDLVHMKPEVRVAFERRLDHTLGVPVESVRCDIDGYPLAPLLVIHDVADREVPFACGETLARHWPGAHLERTEGLGHQRILRDPEVVEAVKRFVAWGSLPE